MPALAKAAHYNIVAITLQEAEESDWVARARQLLQLKEFGVEVIVGERKGPPAFLLLPPRHLPILRHLNSVGRRKPCSTIIREGY